MTVRARRLLLLAIPVCLAVVGAAAAWHLNSRSDTVAPPAIPEDARDEAVVLALTKAREGVLQDPRSAEAWGELGMVFKAHEVNAEAVACFEQAAKLDPADPRWPYLIGVTNVTLARDSIPHLRAAFRLATRRDYKSAARLRLAELLIDAGSYDEARALLEEELQTAPEQPRALLDLGMLELSLDKLPAAIRLLELAAASPYTRAKALRLLASAHRRQEETEAAARCEREAGEAPPDASMNDPFIAEYQSRQVGLRMLNQRAEALQSQGRFFDAAEILEEAARAYPSDQTSVSLGQALIMSGQFERAELALRTALGMNSDHALAHFFLGRTLTVLAGQARESGQGSRGDQLDQEAIQEFHQCLARKPNHAPAHVDLGRALLRLGKKAEAVTACQEAVRLSPQLAETHLALGEVLLGAGKRPEAVSELEKAMKLSPPRDQRAKALLEKTRESR